MDLDSLNDFVVPSFENIALCTQIGEPEWWFDVHAGLKKLARKTCYLCPAFAECRAENDCIETSGAKTGQCNLYGIFAGETPSERRARRKAERNNKPASKGYASECATCGRLLIDQNAVRVTKGRGGKRLYACAECKKTLDKRWNAKPEENQ